MHLTSRVVTRELEDKIGGTAVQELVHLGGYVSASGAANYEIQQRIKGCAVGWARMGQYWGSPAPWRCKRMHFIANVASRAWSGMEAYVLSPRQTAQLDTTLGKKMRFMMQGAAHAVDSAG